MPNSTDPARIWAWMNDYGRTRVALSKPDHDATEYVRADTVNKACAQGASISDALAVVRKVALFNGGYIADDLTKVEAALNAAACALRSYTREAWTQVASYSDEHWYMAGQPWAAADALLAGCQPQAPSEDAGWKTDDGDVKVAVCRVGGDQPFIFWVQGRVTVDSVRDIERELSLHYGDLTNRGDGDYLLNARYFDGQHDELGRCEFPPGWELRVDEFRSIDAARNIEAVA